MIAARIAKTFPEGRESAPFSLELDLEVSEGITALFGPSGSGKTLTLDCIAGFVAPDRGRILIDDRIVFDAEARVNVRPQARKCGYVFQNYALFPHMTLRENLRFAVSSLRRREQVRRVEFMLERFRLADAAGRKPYELSGGQKQRCSIARALIAEPRVLLLDEPVRGLDAPLRADLYSMLHEVRQEFETPMILVTHDLDECVELAGRMLVLRDGRVAQAGTPAEICARPASLELARLLGIFNIVAAEIRTLDPARNASVLRVGEYEVHGEYYPGHLKGDRVHLLATPRQLRALPLAGRPVANQVPAELVRVIDAAAYLRLEFAGGLQVEAPRDGFDRHNREWVIEFPLRGLRVL